MRERKLWLPTEALTPESQKRKVEMGQKAGGERDDKSERVDEIDVARRRGRSLAMIETLG